MNNSDHDAQSTNSKSMASSHGDKKSSKPEKKTKKDKDKDKDDDKDKKLRVMKDAIKLMKTQQEEQNKQIEKLVDRN